MKSRSQEIMFNCKCICSWQPARVVHGDGHVRSVTRPVTVGELLISHPHHFLCEPTSTAPLYHTGMLPLDMDLEEGKVYLLLPLPRLLPHLTSTTFPAPPPSCPCFAHITTHNSSSGPHKKPSLNNQYQLLTTFRWLLRRSTHQVGEAPKIVRSVVGSMSKRMEKLQLVMIKLRIFSSSRFQKLESRLSATESTTSTTTTPSSDSSSVSVQFCSRNRWRPELECISEVDLLTGLLRDSSSASTDSVSDFLNCFR